MVAPPRLFIPAVQVVTVPGITLANLDGSGLRMEWTIRRDNTNKPDTGEVIIFNLDPKIALAVQEIWQVLKEGVQFGISFTLLVGWDRIPKMIFQGDIVKFTPDQRTPTDVLTIWKLGDGQERMRDAIGATSFHNVTLPTALEYLVSLPPAPTDAGGGGLGLIYPPESKALIAAAAAEIPLLPSFGNLPAGINVREAIDLIMDTIGLEWRVQNGAFIAMRGGIIVGKETPVISPATGLISHQLLDDGGIQFTGLSSDLFEPGAQCIVLDEFLKPIGLPAYRIASEVYTGTTDDNSLMEVIARKPVLL